MRGEILQQDLWQARCKICIFCPWHFKTLPTLGGLEDPGRSDSLIQQLQLGIVAVVAVVAVAIPALAEPPVIPSARRGISCLKSWLRRRGASTCRRHWQKMLFWSCFFENAKIANFKDTCHICRLSMCVWSRCINKKSSKYGSTWSRSGPC